MGIAGRIANQVRFIVNEVGQIVGYRNPTNDRDERLFSVGVNFSDLQEPFCIAHRGAGTIVAPEMTLRAFALGASYRGNYIVDGGDWRMCRDKRRPRYVHDTTVDARTTSTGAVSSFLDRDLDGVTVDASSWFGFNEADQVGLLTPEDVFPAYRGRAIFAPEPKDDDSAVYLAGYLSGLGMQPQCFVNTFDDDHGPLFREAGFPYLFRNVAAGSEHTTLAGAVTGPARVAALKALGFDYVALDWNDANCVAAANVCRANGMKFGVYTGASTMLIRQYTKSQIDAALPGISFYVSEDPLYFMGDVDQYRLTGDIYSSSYVLPGHLDRWSSITPGANRRGSVANGRLVFAPSDTQNNFILVGSACPLAAPDGPYTLTFTMKFTTVPADTTRWLAAVVCCPDDRPYTDTGTGVGNNGYQIWVVPSSAGNATLNIVRKTDGSGGTTTTATAAGAIVSGDTVTLAVTVNKTVANGGDGKINVTMTGARSASITTFVDNTWRGAYLYVGHAANASGLVGEIGVNVA